MHLSKGQKEQVAIGVCTRDGSTQEIADKYNVSRYSVYNWAWDLLGKGNVSPMPRKSLIPLLLLKKQWILLSRKSKTYIMKRKTSSVRFLYLLIYLCLLRNLSHLVSIMFLNRGNCYTQIRLRTMKMPIIVMMVSVINPA